MIRFINELRRRHVVRMGLLYVASAFAVLQVSKFFLDLFASPPWIARLLLAALVLLFPLVLALAWRYELTAEGLKPTADTSPDTGTGGRLARRLTLGSVAAVAMTIAALIVWRATPVGSNVVDTPTPAVEEAVVDTASIDDPRPSVAVLPVPEPQRCGDGSLLRRRDARRHTDPARQDCRAEGHCPHLGRTVPRHATDDAADRHEARRTNRARGRRAAGG